MQFDVASVNKNDDSQSHKKIINDIQKNRSIFAANQGIYRMLITSGRSEGSDTSYNDGGMEGTCKTEFKN